ncbi:MAG: hypothetical protein AMJ88_17080 [Anaerolineae bacterium SM23_ 63]|nr:MAG: hypothetical protein AMJ88_17080 [Anaerolineae bacterium SM23_ 63]
MHAKYLRSRRAKRLFDDLDELYFQFASQLPSPLDALAQLNSTYEGDKEQKPFESLRGLNPVLVGTPWLFWETFEGLSDKTFLLIAEAGTYYVLASVVMDHILDGQAKPIEAMGLFHQALYERGIAKYRQAFSTSSSFWDHFERLAIDHLAGLSEEYVLQSHPQRIDREALIKMAHGKVSPIVTTIVGLAETLDKTAVIVPIEASLKHIAVASQLLDDIGDWKHDLQVGHMTYYLSCLTPNAAGLLTERSSLDEHQRKIDAEWLDVEQMGEVIEGLNRSLEAVRDVDCPAWIDYVNGYKTLANEHMTGFVARHIMRILQQLDINPND